MELPGSHYFDTLALISITFAGFAALIAVFRQATGGRFSDYDFFVIRNTLIRSFIVAGCSMLPSLFSLYEFSHPTIWRTSSLIMSLLLILFTLSSYARRRTVTGMPLSKPFLANSFLQILTTIFLLIIALGILQPEPGHFALALATVMMTAIFGYMAALQFLIQGKLRARKRK